MWIYPVDMNRINEFGQTFKKEKVAETYEENENDTMTSNEKETTIQTSKAKKRSVRQDKTS